MCRKQCDACQGMGEQIKASDRCRCCKGKKTVKQNKTIEVYVAKGTSLGVSLCTAVVVCTPMQIKRTWWFV